MNKTIIYDRRSASLRDPRIIFSFPNVKTYKERQTDRSKVRIKNLLDQQNSGINSNKLQNTSTLESRYSPASKFKEI